MRLASSVRNGYYFRLRQGNYDYQPTNGCSEVCNLPPDFDPPSLSCSADNRRQGLFRVLREHVENIEGGCRDLHRTGGTDKERGGGSKSGGNSIFAVMPST